MNTCSNILFTLLKRTAVISPVHVVLVSLLVDQLSGLFLTFLVDQKKFVQAQIFFVHSLEFFVQSFFENWSFSNISTGQNKSRMWTKKMSSL